MSQSLLRVETLGAEIYLARGGMEDADNFTAALSPAVPEEEIASIIRELLAPGWEESFVPQDIALPDPRSGALHLGGVVRRNGRELELLRAFHPGEPVPEGTMSGLYAEISRAVMEALEE